MTYIRRLIGHAVPLPDNEDEPFTPAQPPAPPPSDTVLETHINGTSRVVTQLENRRVWLADQIATLQEEHRQVSVTISAFQLALGEMQANSISMNERELARDIESIVNDA